jgi:Tfp pilus assembly protein PilE
MMVAIAIVGILFRITLPVYQSQVLKTKRYAAQSCLMEYAQYMERYYTTNTSNPMSYDRRHSADLRLRNQFDLCLHLREAVHRYQQHVTSL